MIKLKVRPRDRGFTWPKIAVLAHEPRIDSLLVHVLAMRGLRVQAVDN